MRRYSSCPNHHSPLIFTARSPPASPYYKTPRQEPVKGQRAKRVRTSSVRGLEVLVNEIEMEPREKERDLHCANLPCAKEEQYKKNVNLPPHSSPRKKRGGGGVGGGGGGTLVIVCTATQQCCQTLTLLSRLSWNANQLSPEMEGSPWTQKLRYSRSDIPDLSNKVLPLSGVSSSFGI